MKNKFIVFIIVCIAVITTVWMSKQFIHVNTSPKTQQSTDNTQYQEFDSPTFSNNTPSKNDTFPKKTETVDESSSLTFQSIFGYTSKYGPLPHSLHGTDIDGELLLDANGKLIINNGLRNLFEYFISAKSEEPLDIILGRIREYIKFQIPDEPAQQAIAILDSYVSYKNKLEEVESPEGLQGEKLGTLESVKDALANRMLLRRQFMSPDVVQAFFGDEEKYDQFNLQLIDIKQNSVLTPEAKEQQIIEIEAMLPESVREMRQEERINEKLNQQISEMRKQGKTDEDIYELRKNELGKEKADRWQELDKKRKVWDNKVDSYMKQRESIVSDPNLTDQEKNLAVDRLKFESFDESEIRRINFAEKIHLKQKK
ncbi:lipase chaperone [Candidatus Magnetomorum sp. HK-1]|nr:lipase chaperone [Candidatus Magnetomorum sp. HK-1]